MTELREPHKVLERAAGQPVAILRNAAPARDLVPAEAVAEPEGHRPATLDEVMVHLEATRDEVQPILAYLRGK